MKDEEEEVEEIEDRKKCEQKDVGQSRYTTQHQNIENEEYEVRRRRGKEKGGRSRETTHRHQLLSEQPLLSQHTVIPCACQRHPVHASMGRGCS